MFIRQTRDTLNRGCGSLPAEYENLFEKGWTLADLSLSMLVLVLLDYFLEAYIVQQWSVHHFMYTKSRHKAV